MARLTWKVKFFDEVNKRQITKQIEELKIKIQKIALINYDGFLVNKTQIKKHGKVKRKKKQQ